jgi:hypothetical protein
MPMRHSVGAWVSNANDLLSLSRRVLAVGRSFQKISGWE